MPHGTSRNPSIYREMRELAASFPSAFVLQSGPRLMADLHLIGSHCALFIAHRLDPGNGEVAVVQLGQRFLQCGVKIGLECQLRRWRQDSRVDTVGLPVSLLRNELHLARCGW